MGYEERGRRPVGSGRDTPRDPNQLSHDEAIEHLRELYDALVARNREFKKEDKFPDKSNQEILARIRAVVDTGKLSNRDASRIVHGSKSLELFVREVENLF